VAAVTDPNYTGQVSASLVLTGPAEVIIAGLSQVYDGQPKPVGVTTIPDGLQVAVTYNKSSEAPTNAGTYQVVATIVDDAFSGRATDVLQITKATGTVSFVESTLHQAFGSIRAVGVTTTPEGLAAGLTYNGSAALPNDVGTFEVVATITDSNYQGTGTASLTVVKGAQDIVFPSVPDQTIDGAAILVTLNAVASSGLPITYSVLSGGATVDGNQLRITQPGQILVSATQPGNDRWESAEEALRRISVTGRGVETGPIVLGKPAINGADIRFTVGGTPGTLVAVEVRVNFGAWQSLGQVQIGANGEAIFVDGGGVVANTSKIYRGVAR
jgi:hypothetical protein